MTEQYIIVGNDLSGPVVMTNDDDFVPLEDIGPDNPPIVFDDYDDAQEHLQDYLDDLADDVYFEVRVTDYNGEPEDVRIRG